MRILLLATIFSIVTLSTSASNVRKLMLPLQFVGSFMRLPESCADGVTIVRSFVGNCCNWCWKSGATPDSAGCDEKRAGQPGKERKARRRAKSTVPEQSSVTEASIADILSNLDKGSLPNSTSDGTSRLIPKVLSKRARRRQQEKLIPRKEGDEPAERAGRSKIAHQSKQAAKKRNGPLIELTEESQQAEGLIPRASQSNSDSGSAYENEDGDGTGDEDEDHKRLDSSGSDSPRGHAESRSNSSEDASHGSGAELDSHTLNPRNPKLPMAAGLSKSGSSIKDRRIGQRLQRGASSAETGNGNKKATSAATSRDNGLRKTSE